MMSITQASGWMRAVVSLVAGLYLAVCAGCTEPPERLNAPPQGKTERPHAMQDQYVYMHDNALLAEMSMSPSHFVPHRSELNSLGMRRLSRYADLLKDYGGTLHYDGLADPEPLAQGRQKTIQEFLVSAGVQPESFSVERGLAGGQGMRAQEATLVRQSSTFSPDQQQQQGKGGKWDTGSGAE